MITGMLFCWKKVTCPILHSTSTSSPLAFSGIRNGLALDLLLKLFETDADCLGGCRLISTWSVPDATTTRLRLLCTSGWDTILQHLISRGWEQAGLGMFFDRNKHSYYFCHSGDASKWFGLGSRALILKSGPHCVVRFRQLKHFLV